MLEFRRMGCGAAGMVLTAALLSMPSPAAAQDAYPIRPVRIVVPVAPGGGPDILTRILAETLSAEWKQPVTVENRPGAALNLGAEAVAKAAPDGYTLLATPPGPLVINQHVSANLRYTPSAFAPIAIMAAQPFVLVVGPSVAASDLAQLISHAKSNPGKLTFGSPGVGSPPHLAGEMLKVKAGVDLTHVTYKGMPPAFADLLGGRLDLMFWEVGSVLEHVKSGKVKALGVGGSTRHRELPEVPVISEVLPDFAATTWFALAAPPGTPASVTAKISRDVNGALKLPSVAQRFREFYATPVGGSPEETGAFLRAEAERWREVTAAAGIKPQ